MQLLVIRHGIAVERNQGPDEARPLTDKGRRRTKQVARALQRLVPRLDLLATSPLVRARETAEILARRYELSPLTVPELSPDAQLGRLLEWLTRQQEQVVAIVGHEDGLSTFASWLISARPESHLELKKAGACLVELPGRIEPGAATLKWLATPSQLRRLG
jgi:phosphohistidine phosphatase